jgi:hypothetical protein
MRDMTSYFSQIQYVPDPIAGERINVGVVAIDSSGCVFRFVRDWRRAAAFGGQDVAFLREFAEDALSNGSGWFSVREGTREAIARSLKHWHNKIQFSELRPSTKGRDDLLAEMAGLYLHEGPAAGAEPYRGRGRDKAVSAATKSLGAALRARFGHAPRGLLQRDVPLRGRIESHELDLGLKNGALYGGAFAISFEIGSPKIQQRDTDAIAFALEDIANNDAGQDLAVLVLPPPMRTPTYARARHIFKELDADVVLQGTLTSWANSLIEKLPEDVGHGDRVVAGR